MNSDNNNRPRIGVGVMVWCGDQLLLGRRIHRDGNRTWQFPGGHLEAGESIVQCAQREVSEETGLSIKNITQAGYSNTIFTGSGRHYVTLFVCANYAGGEPEVLEADKCECWSWFNYNELPEPLFLPIINFLKLYPDLKSLRNGAGIPADERK